MASTDLTVRVLREIRDEVKGLRTDQQELREELRGFVTEQRAFNVQAVARFEAIEHALRDLAEQLVILGRGVKVAIEARARVDSRLEDIERRVTHLEKRVP